jgi:hypothetical protein
MTRTWSDVQFTRKIKSVKDAMRKDGFYNDKILVRTITKEGASGLYNRGLTLKYDDYEIDGVAVYRTEYPKYDNEIEVIQSDAQFTCEFKDKDYILNASELWLDYTLVGTEIIKGTKYKIKSNRKSLFGVDHIFELDTVGHKNG